MQYTIMINEEQRQIILNALQVAKDSSSPDAEEHAMLECLFEDLPNIEKENPKMVQGFCL